jgi:hypothetical protein
LIRKYLTILLLITLFTPVFGLATEKYYIDQQPVLLYKIINWWNNCLPDDFKATVNGQSEFRFRSVSETHVQLLKKVEKDIGVVLKGVIGGLINSKIALHPAGKMPNYCFKSNTNDRKQFPITLMIVNAQTTEVLAEYTALWE